jgi:hypothetical protein
VHGSLQHLQVNLCIGRDCAKTLADTRHLHGDLRSVISAGRLHPNDLALRARRAVGWAKAYGLQELLTV